MRIRAFWWIAGALILLGACSEKPEHNANWYYYWEKDNVIPGLDRTGSPASRWDWDVEASNAGVYGASHGPSDGYVLTDLNITASAQLPVQVQRVGGPLTPIGASTNFGVEAAAVTAAHEKEHITIWQQLQNPGEVDLDGDRLADSREGPANPHNLIVGNPDTYQLATFIHINYASYGDNEFLTRVAETVGLASARLDEDWSEGGAQWRH